MKKKEYMQPKSEVIAINGDTMMDGGQWWSVQVNPDEEIEDDDIDAKQGFFSDDDESWGRQGVRVWED